MHKIGLFLFVASCGQAATSGSPSAPAAASEDLAKTAKNVVPIHVDDFNLPTVSVRVCEPGTDHCVDVPNIELDSASNGLRLFKAALGDVQLPTQVDGNGAVIAECAAWVPSFWGPTVRADVTLGGLTASNVVVQVSDPNFATVQSPCVEPVASPDNWNANGILGVSAAVNDCQDGACAGQPYFACQGNTCTAANVASRQAVGTPVAQLSRDNNGVVIDLPALGASGAASVDGKLILGIGTRANNMPDGDEVIVPTAGNGNIQLSVNGQTYSWSFFDTGTSTNDIPNSPLPLCGAGPYLCPTSTTSADFTVLDPNGAAIDTVTVSIANESDLPTTSGAFNNVGSNYGASDTGANLGLPFFFGRRVFFGIKGQTSALGTGPLNAYGPLSQ